jgi:hypothetical protein
MTTLIDLGSVSKETHGSIGFTDPGNPLLDQEVSPWPAGARHVCRSPDFWDLGLCPTAQALRQIDRDPYAFRLNARRRVGIV